MSIKQYALASVRTVVVAVAVVVAGAGSQAAFAAPVNTNSNILKVSPVRSDVEVKPGEGTIVKTTITNITKEDIMVRAIENDFVSGDENGTPALILDEKKFAPKHSLKKFMTPIGDVTIPAGKSKVVEVAINVPKSAQAGGYFGAIRFAPAQPGEGGQVNMSASVASLILLSVPGDTVEQLTLTDFNVQQKGVSGTFFQTPNDLQVTARFQNAGNLQAGPFGKISVKNGDKVVYSTDFNSNNPRDMILPDGARRWNIPVDKVGTFGKYTVLATFTYGKKNQTIEVERTFWVVPQTVIIAAIIGVLVLIALIVGFILFLRGYKNRVLRKSRGLGSN